MQNWICISFLIIISLAFADFEVEVRKAGPLGTKAVTECAENAVITEAGDSIEALYRHEGYLLATVETTIETLATGDIRLAIEVHPRTRSVVVEYDVMGYPFELPDLCLGVGSPFREDYLASDMERLVAELENRCYPFGRVVIDSLEVGPVAGDSLPVKISLQVYPGDSIAIGAIIVPEKARTKPYVVCRTMLMDLPECFSENRLRKGVDRLNNLPYLLVSGEPELLLDESGMWLLRVNIVEKRSVLVNGILGYAPRSGGEEKLTGHLDATFLNMWGTGRNLMLVWDQTAGEHIKINAVYTEPWILGGPGNLSLSGEFYERDSTYSERSFSAEYELPVSFKLNLDLGGAYGTVVPDSIGQDVYNIPRSSEYSVKIGLSWAGLRPRINPRLGFDAKLGLEPSYIDRRGPDDIFETLKRYEPLLRTNADIEVALEPLREQVIYCGLHGRSVISDGPLPLSEKYYLGGWGTLRGYREEQFSSEHLAWGNLEWRALLGGDAHAFAFFDSGIIRPSGEKYTYKSAYGIGLRLSTAIGRWDISYGVATGEPLTAGLIHLGLSTGL